MKKSRLMTNFVDRAIAVHGDRYDYSLVEYGGAFVAVKIICRVHGIFEQRAGKHLRGQGCAKCNRKKPVKLANLEKNKAAAIKVHGDKYDYSKTDFGMRKGKPKTIIICPKHGEFFQDIEKHIHRGQGCSECSGNRKKTTERFIEEAMEVHGELYDYSLSQYTNFETKLIIVCKRHGEFQQTPHNHIIGKQGCPHCVHHISVGETEWLDYLGLPNDKEHRNVFIKLGDRSIKADGYDPDTKTVYEFYGDYYHGNPLLYSADVINLHTKCTFGKLYQRTLEKELAILESGLKLVCIWENEWKILKEKVG
jgi:hypothetical protein